MRYRMGQTRGFQRERMLVEPRRFSIGLRYQADHLMPPPRAITRARVMRRGPAAFELTAIGARAAMHLVQNAAVADIWLPQDAQNATVLSSTAIGAFNFRYRSASAIEL
jgi:hypothetical protein